MRIQVESKSVVEQVDNKTNKIMSLMIFIQFINDDCTPRTGSLGVAVSKEEFDKYHVGQVLELK